MFTGIIEARGRLRALNRKKNQTQMEIAAPAHFCKSLKKGASVSVGGVCLTVVQKKKSGLVFDLAEETKKRSTFGRARIGDRVNLERPLKWQGRVEGHFVLGHTDGVGRIRRIASRAREKSFLIAFPRELSLFVIEKGSVAVDGVSLTIGRRKSRAFWVHLIPHTLAKTRFGDLKEGDFVNLEGDYLLKFQLKKRPRRVPRTIR